MGVVGLGSVSGDTLRRIGRGIVVCICISEYVLYIHKTIGNGEHPNRSIDLRPTDRPVRLPESRALGDYIHTYVPCTS